MRRRQTEAEGKLNRLLSLVEKGIIDLDDPTLKERIATARQARDGAAAEVRLLAGTSPANSSTITPAKVMRLSRALRDVLHNGDIAVRKAYLRMFVGQVVVSNTEIRLSGPTAALATAASANQLPDITMVPSFVPEWRPQQDSNLRPTA